MVKLEMDAMFNQLMLKDSAMVSFVIRSVIAIASGSPMRETNWTDSGHDSNLPPGLLSLQCSQPAAESTLPGFTSWWSSIQKHSPPIHSVFGPGQVSGQHPLSGIDDPSVQVGVSTYPAAVEASPGLTSSRPSIQTQAPATHSTPGPVQVSAQHPFMASTASLSSSSINPVEQVHSSTSLPQSVFGDRNS